MEEVTENVRYSVGNANLTPRTVQPTVGAGGQYTVTPQTPAETGMTKLAKSLALFDSTLGQVAESNVASEQLAEQKVSEMSLEAAKEQALVAKETEDKLYKSGGFFDRLVRTGKAPAQANPLFYSRGQRAYGAKVADQEYTTRVSAAIAEAQKNYRANPDAVYSVQDIQNQIAEQVKGEFGVDVGGSSDMGFASSAGAFNAQQTVRDIEAQDKISRVHSVTFAADDLVGIIKGSSKQKDAVIVEQLMSNVSRHNNLSAKDYSAALSVALSQSASGDSHETQKFINRIRGGKLSGVKLGGFPLDSTAYEQALDRAEAEIESIERDEERDNEASLSRINNVVTNGYRSASSQDYTNGAVALKDVLEDYLIPEGMEGAKATSAEEMFTLVDRAMHSQYSNNKSAVNAARYNFDYNEDNRAYASKARVDNEVDKSQREVFRQNSVRVGRQDALLENIQAPIALQDSANDLRIQATEEIESVIASGQHIDGTDAKINGLPFNDPEVTPTQRSRYLDNILKQKLDEGDKMIAEHEAKEQARQVEEQKRQFEDSTSYSKSDKIKDAYESINVDSVFDNKTRGFFGGTRESQSVSNHTHTIAKAMSNTEADGSSYKYLSDPNTRGAFADYVKSNQYMINNAGRIKGTKFLEQNPQFAKGGAAYTQSFKLPNLDSEEIVKIKSRMVKFAEFQGVRMEDVRNLQAGRVTLPNGAVMTLTDENFRNIPITDASDEDLREAVRIINGDLRSNLTYIDLKTSLEKYNNLRDFNK